MAQLAGDEASRSRSSPATRGRARRPSCASCTRSPRELGVTDRVRFAGFRSDVENVYGAADVVAVPSTQPDPLPNAALEAAAAGCCVVAANHGGLPEIIDDGVTGVLVTPGDPAALAAALTRLRADPAARERLGAAAAVTMRERFSPERLLTQTQALYDGLTSAVGRAQPATRR